MTNDVSSGPGPAKEDATSGVTLVLANLAGIANMRAMGEEGQARASMAANGNQLRAGPTPSAVWSGATFRLRLLAATVVVPVLVMTCVPTCAALAAGQVEKGRLLAERMCAVCHLNSDQGDKAGPGTVPGFVAVAKRPGQTIEGIITWLRSVPAMMPNHHLSQDEMEALAFFILSLGEGVAGGEAQ